MTRAHTPRVLIFKVFTSLALAASIALPSTASDHSREGLRWSAGVDFAVGGVGFSLGFLQLEDHHGRRGHDHGHHRGLDRSYFYVTGEPLSYAGHECGSACFVHDDRYFHHPDCPIVLGLFESHGFDPYPTWRALPDGGLAYYSLHHGSDLHDDHRGRRGRGRGRGRHGRRGHS